MLVADGIHMTPEAHERVALALEPLLLRLMQHPHSVTG